MPVNRSVAVRLGVNVDMDQARRDLEGITSQVNRLGATRTDAARAQFEQLGATVGRTATAYKGLTDEQRRAYEQREADAQQVTRLRRAFSTLEGALAALDTQVQHGHRSAEEAARLQEGLVAAYTDTGRAAREVAAANSNLLGSMTGLQRGWVDMHAAIARNKADLGELVSAIKAVGAAQRDAASPMQQQIAATVGISDGPSVANDARQRDLEAWSREIDAVRARLVPGEQAVQRYQAALLDLAEAQRTGAVAGADFEKAQAHIEATLNPAVLAARKEEQALRGLIDDLDESATASKRLAEQQALLDKALAGQVQGVTLSRAEHERLSAKLRETAGANDNTTRSTKLAAHEMVNLSYQIQDLGVQLVSGQSPFIALAQQGPQAVMAVGGLNRALALLLSPVGLVVIGVGAVVGAAGALIALREGYTSSVREMTRANELMGNSLGVTSGQLEAMADRAADAGEISTRSARSMIAEYTALGKTAPDVVERLTAVTRDFARGTSQDLDAAGKELSGYFKDPARGAEELAAKYNMLSGATLDYIRRLTESGQKAEAQRVLVDALGQRVKAAAEETSIWARAWEAVGRNASNAADSIGRVIDRAVNGPTLEQKVEAARKAMIDARQAAKPRTGGIIANQHAYDEQLDEAQADAAAAEKRYNDLMEEVRERNRAAAVRGVAANNNAASRDALAVTERYDALGQSLRKAQGELATLQRGLGPNMGQAAGAGQRAVEALQNQISDLTKVQASGLDLQAYKTKELAALEARYAGQLGPAAAARKAEEAARINLLGTATTTAERSTQADAARSQVIAGQTQALAQQSAALTVNARESLTVADAYEKSAAAGAAAEARRQAMTEAISSGVDVETRAAQLLQERAAQQAATSAQGLRQQQDEVAGRERVAEATLRGAAAQHEAELAEKVRAGTLAEVTALENASGETADKLRGIIERKTKAILADDAAQRRSTIALAIRQQQDQIELGQRQLELIGASAEARAVEIARLQALITLRNQNIDAASAEGQQYLRNAETMARQGLELERVTAGYQELAQFGERSFDAIINATAQAEDATLGWRNALSTVGAELKTLAIRMVALNPAKNLLLGTNLPTVADLPIFGGARAASGTTGALGQAGSAATNWAGSQAMSWIGDKLGLSNITGNIMNTPLWGSAVSMSSVGGGATIIGTANPIIGSATGAIQAGSLNAANGVVNAGNTAALNASYSGTASGAAGTAGASLGSVLSTAGIGFGVGNLATSLFGVQSKGMGALVGAGSGAAAGALAGTFLFPGVGTLIGAILGGGSGLLGGLLGAQKPSVGPTASADLTVTADGKASVAGNYLTDNEGSIEAAKQLGAAFSTIFTAAAAGGGTLVKNIGIGRTEKDGFYVAGSVPYKKYGDDLPGLLRDYLLEQGGLKDAGPAVTKAIKNNTAKDFDEAAKNIALGAGIDAGTTALTKLDKSLAGVTRSAKEATVESLKPMLDEFERAKSLDLGTEYSALATKQMESMLDQLRNPVDFTQREQDMATVAGQFAAIREAAVKLNPALGATVDGIEAETKARIKRQAEDEANRALNSALGRDYVNSINDLVSARDVNARNLAATGADTKRATEIYDASLKRLLEGLDSSQLDVVATLFTGSIHDLAVGMRDAAAATENATKAAERSAYQADLNSRMYAAVGNDRAAGLIALDQQQAQELATAKAAGYSTTRLQQVQAAERAQKAFDLAQQALLGAYDAQITAQQDYINTLSAGAVKVAQAAGQFRSAYDALAINDNSPLNARDRLDEARRQFEEDYTTYKDNAATEAARDAAKQDLLSMGPALVQLAKGFFGSTDVTDYNRVRQVFAELGDTTALGVDTAQRELETAQNTLKELQRQRAEAAAMGQKQYGAVNDLKDVATQSLTVLQSALGPLKALTGATDVPHYSASAAVQSAWDGLSAEQKHGVMRARGWEGDLDASYNYWLATDRSRASTFESDVLAIAGGTRFAADATLQRAWDALTAAQQLAAVREAGYDGGIDAGLNAWVVLGHQTAFANAVRAAAHSAGVPGFATGTLATPPGAIWVGEQGPELLWQGGGAAIASSADSLRIARSLEAANDRWTGNVTPFRLSAASVDMRGVEQRLDRAVTLLERILTAIKDGDDETVSAISSLNKRLDRAAAPVGRRIRVNE